MIIYINDTDIASSQEYLIPENLIITPNMPIYIRRFKASINSLSITFSGSKSFKIQFTNEEISLKYLELFNLALQYTEEHIKIYYPEKLI